MKPILYRQDRPMLNVHRLWLHFMKSVSPGTHTMIMKMKKRTSQNHKLLQKWAGQTHLLAIILYIYSWNKHLIKISTSKGSRNMIVTLFETSSVNIHQEVSLTSKMVVIVPRSSCWPPEIITGVVSSSWAVPEPWACCKVLL